MRLAARARAWAATGARCEGVCRLEAMPHTRMEKSFPPAAGSGSALSDLRRCSTAAESAETASSPVGRAGSCRSMDCLRDWGAERRVRTTSGARGGSGGVRERDGGLLTRRSGGAQRAPAPTGLRFEHVARGLRRQHLVAAL
eukprot:4287326-Prymnesium_polylepis.2